MQEELIHFIWLNQLFNKSNLKTVFGEQLSILKQGIHNVDAGPDFSNAMILMDELEWRGDVEIHYKSSQWNEHKHNKDISYNQVILHVVWEHDKEVYRYDGSKLPTIELKDRVSNSILEQANSISMSPHHVPCQNYLNQVDSIHILSALNRALIQRLEQKSDKILLALENTKGDWEEVAYQWLANILGSKVNGDAFQELALRMPFKILKKYSDNLLQLEALLFGVSGLLVGQNKDDEYLVELENEFAFLAEKHGLKTKVMALSWWKFSRLRPANFPTIRIAQLARILNTNSNLFSLFIDADISMLSKKLRVVQSEYWQNHYLPDRFIDKSINGLGKASLDSIVINVAAPISMAYARSVNDLTYQERAVTLLSSLAPEVNRISKMWRSLGVNLNNGAETQGAIELFNSECANKKCLTCGIGFQILKSA